MAGGFNPMMGMGGGMGGPMQFIKSRAKMYDPELDEVVTFADVAVVKIEFGMRTMELVSPKTVYRSNVQLLLESATKPAGVRSNSGLAMPFAMGQTDRVEARPK